MAASIQDKVYYFEKIDSDSDTNEFIVIYSQFINWNYNLLKWNYNLHKWNYITY